MTRKETIKVLSNSDKAWRNFTQEEYIALETAIQVLEQEPKIGHWFVDERPESNREVICSNCEQTVFKYHKLDFDYRPKYCPNCGAKMVDEQKSEEI